MAGSERRARPDPERLAGEVVSGLQSLARDCSRFGPFAGGCFANKWSRFSVVRPSLEGLRDHRHLRRVARDAAQ